jgi:hypothetical protein
MKSIYPQISDLRASIPVAYRVNGFGVDEHFRYYAQVQRYSSSIGKIGEPFRICPLPQKDPSGHIRKMVEDAKRSGIDVEIDMGTVMEEFGKVSVLDPSIEMSFILINTGLQVRKALKNYDYTSKSLEIEATKEKEGYVVRLARVKDAYEGGTLITISTQNGEKEIYVSRYNADEILRLIKASAQKNVLLFRPQDVGLKPNQFRKARKRVSLTTSPSAITSFIERKMDEMKKAG